MARGHFAKSEKQAASVMKELQGRIIKSVGTVRNYEQALKTATDFVKENRLGGLRDITPEIAHQYLSLRQEEVSQSTLNMDRQALQCMMRHVTHQLGPNDTLKDDSGRIYQSQLDKIEQSRAYTTEQAHLIAASQSNKHQLATLIAHSSGLRAHELLTLRPLEEKTPSPREAHPDKFTRLPSPTVAYTVEGKGGLIRKVHLLNVLSEQLEKTKLPSPQRITDRGIHYQQHYGIGGGKQWSDSFSKASTRVLGWSHGGHGLRHSYAQDRMDQLSNHHPRETALRIVSQEMGHFRPDITEVYLR